MATGRTSRNKGARGEREVIGLLQPIVDEECDRAGYERIGLQRNLLQAHKGGCDLHGLDWLSLEVKRVEQHNLNKWWRQTLAQARPGQVAVLLHRKNNDKWRVRLRADIRCGKYAVQAPVDISLPTFLIWFRHRVRHAFEEAG